MKNNFNSKRKTLLTLLLCIPLFLFSQIEMKWNKKLPSAIKWQEISSLGNLVVATNQSLMGINTDSGAINWSSTEHANLDKSKFKELANSPFFTIKNNGVIYVIDQFSGDEVFNSAKAGISTIKDYYLLYKSDMILVAGNDLEENPVMISVQMSSGGVSWTIKEKFGSVVAAKEVENDKLLIVTLFYNYLLNAKTGEIIWKEATSKEVEKINNMGMLGSLIKVAAEDMSEDMDIELNYYSKPSGDIFYLGNEEEETSPMSYSSSSQKKYINNYMAYNIQDGSLVWDKPLEVKGKSGFVSFLEDGILALPNDGNNTKINVFDYKTKEGKWGKKGRGIAVKGGVYNYIDTGSGIVLVSKTTNYNYLSYLDPKAGILTFKKPVKIEGRIVGIVPLSKSILYITSNSINILDYQKGTLKWKKSIRTKPELTAEYNGKIYVFDQKEEMVKIIDKETEELTTLSATEIKFKGKEAPRKLEVMEDGVFLHSDQNVAKIDFNGALKFIEYYAAPRESGWKRALLYAETARAAYISAYSYYASGSIAKVQEDINNENIIAGAVVSEIGDFYGELGEVSANYAEKAFKQANLRMKATKSGRDFMFVMSKIEKDIVLLKVSKITGKVEGKIILGKDREPNYAVDDITGNVFYRTGNNKITSYQVK
jgi:hypothetical protein